MDGIANPADLRKSGLSIMLAAAFLLPGACADGKPTPQCVLTPNGIYQYIGTDADLYGDIVSVVQTGAVDALINAAPEMHALVLKQTNTKPLICVADGVSRSVKLTYNARAKNQVGANLDLYYGENDKLKVVEFYIVPLAP